MLEDLNLSQIATVLGRDAETDPMFKKVKRGIAAYGVAKTVYGGGKATYERWQKRNKTHTVKDKFGLSVTNNDDAYRSLYDWVISNRTAGDDRSVRLSTKSAQRSTHDFTDDDDGPTDPDFSVDLITDSDYAHNVTINGHDVDVEIVKGGIVKPADDGGNNTYVLTYADKNPDRIVITTDSIEAREAVREFIYELVRKTMLQRSVYRQIPQLMMARHGRWSGSGIMRLRPMDSVVLRKGQIEPIVNDMEAFLGAEKKYIRRSIPWHRGYLFYGPPGTGKTSLAMGLASHFGLHLYYIPLGDLDKDFSLIDLVNSVSERSILLFEDVDVFSAATKRTKDDKAASLSALLNALDGAMTPHGLITIMTTNNLDALDTALVRPGRVDLREELTYVDEDQASRLFRNFYPEAKDETASRVGRACTGMAPAEILEVCKRHLEEAKVAADELCDRDGKA